MNFRIEDRQFDDETRTLVRAVGLGPDFPTVGLCDGLGDEEAVTRGVDVDFS